jgi:negative regulator of flagellin synthesis FlgM
MKINGVSGPIGAYQQNGTRKVSRAQEVARPAKSDGVELSREAREVRSLHDKLSQAPDARSARVAELKRQIEAGTYKPNAHEVAAKMIKARVFDEFV